MQESWIAEPPRRRTNFDLVACALLFLASATLRLYFVYASQDVVWLRTPWPGGDVDLYWRAAIQLRAGLPYEPSFEIMMASAPLYVFWLAATQSVLGESLLAHRVLGALLFSVTPVVVYRIGSLVFSDRPAAVAGAILLVLLPSALFFDTIAIKSSLGLLLLSLLIHQLVTIESGRSLASAVSHGGSIGILLSLLLLLQQSAFLYTVVAVSYAARRTDLASLQRRALLAATLAVVILTAAGSAARHSLLGQQSFSPQSGVHVRLGSGDHATGYRAALPDIPAVSWGQSFIARMDTEVRHEKLLTPAEANAQLLLDATRDALRRPLRAIGLAYHKFQIVLNDFEPADEHFLPYIERTTPFIRRVPGRYGLLVMFAGVGLLSLLSSERRKDVTLLIGFLVATLASNLLTYVTWRIRLDTVIPLALLAGAGISLCVELLSEWQTSRYTWRPLIVRKTIAVVFVAFLSCWLAFRTLLPRDLDLVVRSAARNVERSKGAERALRSLDTRYEVGRLESDDEWIARARLLFKLERHSENHALLEWLVTERGTLDRWANGQYLTYLLWMGDVDRAVAHLDLVARRDPRVFEQIMSRRPPVEGRFIEQFVAPRLSAVSAAH